MTKRIKTYLVGGAVRDTLLGRTVQDRDFVVIGATEDEFLAHFASAKKVGAREPVYIHEGDEYTLSKAKDIHADLMERDLTINAIARDDTGRIFALPGSLSDLEKKVLKPISETNFLKDPNRVFRSARLSACFPDFKIDASLIPVMQSVSKKGLLNSIAAERVGSELIKACAGREPGRCLAVLSEAFALTPWLAEFSSAGRIPAGPEKYHTDALLGHTIGVMNRLNGSAMAVWMGFCHDMGKTQTDPSLLPKHHGHDKTGETIAAAVGKRLRLPRRFIQAGGAGARWHMVAGQYDQLKPGTKTNLLLLLHKLDLVKPLFSLVMADQRVDFSAQAEKDLSLLLSVKLPEKYQGLGKLSGQKLFQERCQALAGKR